MMTYKCTMYVMYTMSSESKEAKVFCHILYKTLQLLIKFSANYPEQTMNHNVVLTFSILHEYHL